VGDGCIGGVGWYRVVRVSDTAVVKSGLRVDFSA
jgi:hypothetical protein